MASSTCATTSGPEAAHVPTGSTQPTPTIPLRAQSHTHSHKGSAGSNSNNNSNSQSDDNSSTLHAHRQSHNSSKLPAFRFADLKKDTLKLPPLLQHFPPSPISPKTLQANPDSALDLPQDASQSQQNEQRQSESQRIIVSSAENDRPNTQKPPKKENPVAPASTPRSAVPTTSTSQSPKQQSSPPRTRASTLHSPTAANPSTRPTTTSAAKRPASFPDSPIANTRSTATKSTPASARTSLVTKSLPQRASTINLSERAETAFNHPPASLSNRSQSVECDESTQPIDYSTKEWAQRQRESVLHKFADGAKAEDKRRSSRPPVSFRPPNVSTAAAGRPVIPPIRSFRSSGSRKSVVLDMHTRRVSDDSTYGEDVTDPNVRDRTLRALEGRMDDDYSHVTPPDSATATPDDNTAEIFMNIAREDPTRRALDDAGIPDDQSAISRVTRTARRRPLSVAVSSYQTSSPPQVTRRLSDQRETSRTRRATGEQSAQHITRELAYRTTARDKDRPLPSESNQDEATKPQLSRSALRPSPLTPRQITFQETTPESTISSYSRRRASLTESNGLSSRASHLRSANLAYGSGRTYHSSPLVPKPADTNRQETLNSAEATPAVEGTESSTSTAAPSTVWDELDDLKSRIHRLELTGKLPASSVAAMSRASDDRPPTATTNATTMSASPKRGSGQSALHVDVASTTSSQKEPQQPILLSALNKTKTLVKSEVFNAIESAASEALALSTMMGTAGQPGPISSGASTIGAGGTVTDRQLRKKADSICRSLTELCLALAEETPQPKQAKALLSAISTSIPPEKEIVASPTALKPAPAPVQRRASAITPEQSSLKVNTSPRAPTSLEQRRMTMLNSTALPSPRYALAPKTPTESSAGRKSSLIIARARRAGTDEPEESVHGRKSSLLLRTRRAGTEEPEETTREGRKTSLLLRTRRDVQADEDDESRFRAPSRANTELTTFRAVPRESGQAQASVEDSSSPTSTTLPRRRFVPSSLSSRLAGPLLSTPSSSRRFFDRPTPERDSSSVVEKLAEERGQRQFSLSQTAILNRTSSINRRRDSAIPSIITSPTSPKGGYR